MSLALPLWMIAGAVVVALALLVMGGAVGLVIWLAVRKPHAKS